MRSLASFGVTRCARGEGASRAQRIGRMPLGAVAAALESVVIRLYPVISGYIRLSLDERLLLWLDLTYQANR